MSMMPKCELMLGQAYLMGERRGGKGTREAREEAPGMAGSEGDEEAEVGRPKQVLFA